MDIFGYSLVKKSEFEKYKLMKYRLGMAKMALEVIRTKIIKFLTTEPYDDGELVELTEKIDFQINEIKQAIQEQTNEKAND